MDGIDFPFFILINSDAVRTTEPGGGPLGHEMNGDNNDATLSEYVRSYGPHLKNPEREREGQKSLSTVLYILENKLPYSCRPAVLARPPRIVHVEWDPPSITHTCLESSRSHARPQIGCGRVGRSGKNCRVKDESTIRRWRVTKIDGVVLTPERGHIKSLSASLIFLFASFLFLNNLFIIFYL